MAKATNLVWTFDYAVPTGDSAPTFAVDIVATDIAGNSNASATGVQSVIVDNSPPTVAAGAITVTSVTANAGYAREGSVITIPLTITEASTGVSTKPTVTLTKADGTSIATMAVSAPTGTAPTYTCNATYTMTSSDAEVLLHYTISDATDGAGNVMTAAGPTSTGRTYDRSLPTASYIYLGSGTSPGATYTATGTPAVYSDAADANGLFAQFSYDGTSWTTLAAFASGTTTVNLTSGSQGSRQVQMRLSDAAGNQKATAISDTIVFDSIKPVASVTDVTVSAGNTGYAIEGSVITLTISVAEETSGMKTAPSASIRNASDGLIADMSISGPAGTGPYVYTATYTMDGDDPEVELYYRVIGAEDNAGNVMTAGGLVNLNRTYDRTVPAPAITAPAAAAYVNADATMTILADGGTLTAQIGSNSTASYTSGSTKISALAGWSSIDEGDDVAVTVYSTDTAGNKGSATRTFKKDTAKPVASVTDVTVSAGNTGYAIEGSVITLTISVAEETSGMKTAPSASIRNASDGLIADMSISGPAGTGPYVYTATYTMDGDDPEVELYYRVIGAEDNAGNVMTAGGLVNLNRTYDRTVPAPAITAPAAAAYVNADATMTILADGGTLTAQIGSNSTASYTSGSTKISALAGWSSIDEGDDVAVTVYSTDTAGNKGSATRTFKKDTTVPSVTAYSYETTTAPTITLYVTATDTDGSGISAYAISGDCASKSQATSPITVTLTNAAAVNTISIVVTDAAGNATTKNATINPATTTGGASFSLSTPTSVTPRSILSSIGSAIGSAFSRSTSSMGSASGAAATDPITTEAAWVQPKASATKAPAEAKATRPTSAFASPRSESAQAKAAALAKDIEATSKRAQGADAVAQPARVTTRDVSAPWAEPAQEMKGDSQVTDQSLDLDSVATRVSYSPSPASAAQAAAPQATGAAPSTQAPSGDAPAPDGMRNSRAPVAAGLPRNPDGRAGKEEEEVEE